MSLSDDSDQGARTHIGFIVTLTSIVGVLLLSCAIVYWDSNHSDAASRVLGSVLPVIGTWVGTVLAFYFGKENFETAARSVGAIAKQLSPVDRLKSFPVKDKMIPKEQIFFKQLPVDALKIADVLTELRNTRKGDRLPVLTQSMAPKYIIHGSMLTGYLAGKAQGGGAIDALTFADLSKDRPDLMNLFESSLAVVTVDSTLAEAKTAMDQVARCEDVFVTAMGSRQEPILGWVTDNIIQANLVSR